MNLKKKLESVVQNYRWQFESIVDFLDSIRGFLNATAQRIWDEQDFTADEASELEALADALFNVASAAKEGKKHAGYTLDISERVADITKRSIQKHGHQTLLAEMVIVHLFSYLEALLADYLAAIYIHRPSLLKDAEMVEPDMVLRFKSMKKLKNHLAEEESRRITYGNIDNTARYYSRKFQIDLREFPEWEELREAYYRRNAIVHNQSKVSNQYLTAVEDAAKLGTTLYSDTTYASKVAALITEFVVFFHDSVLKKFKLTK